MEKVFERIKSDFTKHTISSLNIILDTMTNEFDRSLKNLRNAMSLELKILLEKEREEYEAKKRAAAND